MGDDFSQDLSAWLDATSDRYVVERTLKETPAETTQVVYRRGAAGEAATGPFVRKIFADDMLGAAYRLLLDAQTTGRRFSHLPLIYECEHTGTTFEVVMECVRGETLASYVGRVGQGTATAARVFSQLCDALGELHTSLAQPVIHRDVKPSNVMVSDGHVTLIDLGIARAWHDDATRDTVRYGTPGYAPPEQYGYGQTSVRSDVYAAGMTLAYCLLGADASPRLVESGFDDARIPPALREVLAKATRFDPAQRYGSAAALRDAFERAARPALERKRVRAELPDLLGRMWNALVVLVWALLMMSLFNGVVHPIESLASAPLWLLVVMYVGVFVVPFTAAAYLLLDKRRIPHPPWRRYVAVCVGAAVAGFLVTFVAYLIAM